MTNTQSFVTGFRNSAPYINALRNRTLVISFGGEAVLDKSFPDFIHDIALLNSLGIRLVLVHGARPQIERTLQKDKEASSETVNNLRITSLAILECVKQAVGNVRVEIEALLSMGLANSPMAGSKIRVTSGNYVTAKPIGVINGIDYEHTGEVRRVDHENIHKHLDNGEIVLISPIGYSPTGEIFNINAEDVASAVAIELKADKLIYLTEVSGIQNNKKQTIPELLLSEAESILVSRPKTDTNKSDYLGTAVLACRQNVSRVHIIDRRIDGALIQELFTRDGIGTLISSDIYEGLRPATIDDVSGILELIAPLEDKGILTKRSRDRLELEINHFMVVERDGTIIACSALYPFPEESIAEIACLAVHPEYQNSGRGNNLFDYMVRRAKEMELKKLFVLTTQTTHWFLERGFKGTDINNLPLNSKKLYNNQRKSKVYIKTI